MRHQAPPTPTRTRTARCDPFPGGSAGMYDHRGAARNRALLSNQQVAQLMIMVRTRIKLVLAASDQMN